MSTTTLEDAPSALSVHTGPAETGPADKGSVHTGPAETGAARMLAAIASLPEQLAAGVEAAGDLGRPFNGRVRRAVICGMGGSAFPADLLRLHAAQRAAEGAAPPLQLHVVRDYGAEAAEVGPLGPDDLVVASSFSGNTEETLAAYEAARAAGAAVVALCAGGALARRAAEHGVPRVALQAPAADFQPRAASGLFVGAFAGLLDAAGLLPGSAAALRRAGPALATLLGESGLRPLPAAAQAAGATPDDPVVAALRDRIPVFYAGGLHAAAVARIAKIKINENAKMPAFFAALPEFNHNEMVGFTRRTGHFVAVFVEDPHAAPAMKRRLMVSVQTLEKAGLPVLRLPLPNVPDRLVAALAWLYRIDLASVALAVAAGIDPNPVAMVEAFKRDLAAAPPA